MKTAPPRIRRRLSPVFALLCAITLLCASALTAGIEAWPGVAGARDAATPPPAADAADAAPRLTPDEAREAYGRIELSFEANRGQTDPSVGFLARGAGYTIFLKPTEAVFVLARRGGAAAQDSPGNSSAGNVLEAARGGDDGAPGAERQEPPKVLRMRLVGARETATVEGADESEGRVNYFLGSDPSKWRADVPTYSKVRYAGVYPGVDLVYYGNQRQLEYDFVVAPGREASAVKLKFDGADKVETDAAGDLLLTLGDAVVRQPKPVVYQEVGGARREVEGGYAVDSRGRVGFSVGEYDRALPLVIDPVIVYSTYLGGSGEDEGIDIAVDSSGSAYVCGSTDSANFPTANAFDATFGSGQLGGQRDAFVTKLNAAGNGFVYSTYLGGSGDPVNTNINGDDLCFGIRVDASGNAYLAGETHSNDFPTANAFQATYGGGLSDAFVTKLNAAGNALVFSTYLGGSIFDAAGGIALDSSNNIYITGRTTSDNYPTLNPIQAAYSGGPGADVIITKLNAAGTALVYSTYLGGNAGTEGGFENGSSIDVDSAGNAYVTGQTRSTNFPTANPIQAAFGGGFPDGDAFVTKVNVAGSALVFSTYLGGSANDVGADIDVDASGVAHVAGFTASTNFPTANAFQGTFGGGTLDGFVTKFNAAGTAFAYSTYLGGSGGDACNDIAVDAAGNTHVAGGTGSTNFPLVNPVQATLGSANGDTFVTKFNPAATTIIYSTYLGGNAGERANAIALDSADGAYVTGLTESTNFPTLNPAQAANGGGIDGYVYKLSDAPPATPTPTPTPTPTATPTPTPTPAPTPQTFQFSAATYAVGENAGSVTITVERAGGNAPQATVAFATAPDASVLRCDVVNGTASERCDFTTRIATLRFAVGETSKTVRVFITDDVYVEGNETFQVSLSSPAGGPVLGTPATATVTITDNDTSAAANPVYTPAFFVRMHYIDFLNREGEPAGFNGWVNSLTACQPPRADCDHVMVSSSFFRSVEFFMKGYYVIRFYKVSLGTNPNYRDFTRDSQRVTADTSAEVLAARQEFAQEWVQRADFKAIYDGLSNQAYVDKLEQTAGVALSNKAQLVASLDNQSKTRAQVLMEIVESAEVQQRMYNDAFVSMQYFGYLRRDPEVTGFNAWLAYLNANPSDFRTMVGGFINSLEYRLRFGPSS